MPTKFDAQLHVLRSVANSVTHGVERHEALTARHQLFTALEADNSAAAREWLEALDVALHSLTYPLEDKILGSVDRAIGTIRNGLKE